MGQHLNQVLEEFANQRSSPGPASLQAVQIRIAAAQSISTPVPIHINEAYAKGYEDGKQSARVQAQAELDAALLDYQQRLEGTEAQFSERLADELCDKLHWQINRLQDSISDQLVAALLPLLRFALTEATIREMAEGLRILTADQDVIHVELAGPKDLIEKVWQVYCQKRACTSTAGPEARIVINEAAELRVTVNDSTMQARLMEWVSRLERLLANVE